MKIFKLIKKCSKDFTKEIKVKIINPTMAESFGERLDKNFADKYLDPLGFLKENEFEEYEGIAEKDNKMEIEFLKLKKNNKNVTESKENQNIIKTINEIDYELNEKLYEEKIAKIEQKDYNQRLIEMQNHSELPKEYGFKTKGPEPTRYGDWAHKGKVVDF
jgi:hypothetical protein